MGCIWILGHHAGGTTDAYAKFNPSYMGAARAALTAIIENLARDVPRLRALLGVSLGSVKNFDTTLKTTKSYKNEYDKVVGGTGFEPVTPTMSR